MSRASSLLFSLCILTSLTSLANAQKRPPTLDPTYGLPLPKRTQRTVRRPADASWIWASTTKDNQTVYVRRVFTVPIQPKAAHLYITVDNYFDLFLDGHRIVAGLDKKNDMGWDHATKVDVTSALTPGKHVLAVEALNAGGPAGVIARLQTDTGWTLLTDRNWRVTATKPDGDWKAVDYRDEGWERATPEGHMGEGPWDGQVQGWPVAYNDAPPYLFHMRIDPVRIAFPAAKPDLDKLPWKSTLREIAGRGNRILFDFGKELTGRVRITATGACTVKVGTGESAGEAWDKPYTSADLALEPGQVGYTPYSAFRYVSVTTEAPKSGAEAPHSKALRAITEAPKSGAEAPHSKALRAVTVQLDHLYYPVQYRGAFDCSDPLLTRIWYTGAYTAHLCMQQDIWDAPKRDRARWMGDLHVSGETINNVFLDRFLMEQTMSSLRKDAQGGKPYDQLPSKHVNDIPGYSCAWVAGLADFYRHTGDLDYLRQQHDAIVSMLDFFKTELGEDGTFANKHGQWPFVDWSDGFNKDTPLARATTHMFLVYALHEGSYLLGELGDQANQRRFNAWADELTKVARDHYVTNGTYGSRRQENAMAVYSGVATPDQCKAIDAKIFERSSGSWKQIATPYHNSYFIFALSKAGHTQTAMDFVRWYWGSMLAEGATSTWEGYDPSWNKHNSHLHLGADDGFGYFVSLAHGWSTGPTNWLTEQVLGVRPTSGGFATCVIDPDLGDLKWVSGTVPTPHGPIKAKVRRSGKTYKLTVTIPKGVAATITLPGPLTVNGRNVTHDREQIQISTPGTYVIRSRG